MFIFLNEWGGRDVKRKIILRPLFNEAMFSLATWYFETVKKPHLYTEVRSSKLWDFYFLMLFLEPPTGSQTQLKSAVLKFAEPE